MKYSQENEEERGVGAGGQSEFNKSIPGKIAIRDFISTFNSDVALTAQVDPNYGNTGVTYDNLQGNLKIGSRTYKNSKEYKNSVEGSKFELNKNKMKEVKEDGTLAASYREYQGKQYTVIGPYYFANVGGNLTKAIMGNKKAVGYSTSVNFDQIKDFRTATDWKQNEDFYLIFEGDVTDQIDNITLHKEQSYIKVRAVFIEGEGNSHQNNVIFYTTEEKEEKEITLPKPEKAFLQIKKVDADVTSNELKNAEFVVKKGNQYAVGGIVKDGKKQNTPAATWTDKINQATKYHSGDMIAFKQKGTYTLLEVKRHSESYEECSEAKPIEVGAEELELGKEKTIVAKNKRKYVKISGYVWEDKPSDGKISDYNDLYEEDSTDKKVGNVTVRLKNSQGEILGETKTNAQGNYLFKEIEITELEGAYIEFIYNGMCYESVPVKQNQANGSKAADENRDAFNQQFATITKDKATNGETAIDLSYHKDGGVSTLKYNNQDESKLLPGYDGQKYPIAGVEKQYEITASTKETQQGFLGRTDMEMEDIYTQGKDEVENINLGIKEKEQPDIGLVKDIDNVKIAINGKTQVYQYGERFRNAEFTSDFLAKYKEQGRTVL